VRLDADSLTRWWQRLIRLALATLLLACIISLLEVDTNPRIVVVDQQQSILLHSLTQYQAAAASSLHNSLANSNKITFNSASVVDDMKATFPEVNDASVVLPLVGHRPTVYLQLAKPVLILQSSTQSVVVANSGEALVTATQVAGLSQFDLPVVTDQSNLALQVGDPVLASTTVSFVQTVLAQLSAQHISWQSLILPAGTEELDVHLAGKPYYVKFNIHLTNPLEQVGSYLAAQQHLTGQGIVPTQYIDVRVPGRAYYK
jgi:hypothetical protein